MSVDEVDVPSEAAHKSTNKFKSKLKRKRPFVKKSGSFVKKTGKRPAFARSKSKGPQAVSVEQHLLTELKRLYDREPDHPMFGPHVGKTCTVPYIIPGQGGQDGDGCSWRSICRSVAHRLRVLGVTSLAEARLADKCWLSRNENAISFYRLPTSAERAAAGKKKQDWKCDSRKVKFVRVLAYLRKPTRENFTILSTVSHQAGFSHYCGNGVLKNGWECINAWRHGAFEARAMNESRKLCLNGAVCLCPHKPKCIFMHRTLNGGEDVTAHSGTLQPCRNVSDRVPQCNHDPRCY